jgi:hypothetical protein
MIYESLKHGFSITLASGKLVRFTPVVQKDGRVFGELNTASKSVQETTGMTEADLNAVVEKSETYARGKKFPGIKGIWRKDDRVGTEVVEQETESYASALQHFGDEALKTECKAKGIKLAKDAGRKEMVGALLEFRKTGKITTAEAVATVAGNEEPAKAKKPKAAVEPPPVE